MKPVVVTLEAKGRCCGKKPLVYKRQNKLYCTRCSAEFDLEGSQKPSFSWTAVGNGFCAVAMNNNANADAVAKQKKLHDLILADEVAAQAERAGI